MGRAWRAVRRVGVAAGMGVIAACAALLPPGWSGGGGTLGAEAGPVGGRNVTLTERRRLTWDAGIGQAGYVVYRTAYFRGGIIQTSFLPVGGLPSDATSFQDEQSLSPGAACYTVLPLDAAGNGLGRSDTLCITIGGSSGGGYQPVAFSVTLAQSTTATLTWQPTTVDGRTPDAFYVLQAPLNGNPPTTIALGTAHQVSLDTGGIPTCYGLFATHTGTKPLGWTAGLCVVPGTSQLDVAGTAQLAAVAQQLTPHQWSAGPLR